MNTLPPLPQAIHPHSLEVSPDYRAGWNDCHDEFTRAIAATTPKVPALPPPDLLGLLRECREHLPLALASWNEERDKMGYFWVKRVADLIARVDATIAAVPAPIVVQPELALSTGRRILAITTAYEQGVGKGHQAFNRSKEITPPYEDGTDCHGAWGFGYQEGKEQASRGAALGVQATPLTGEQITSPVVPTPKDATEIRRFIGSNFFSEQRANCSSDDFAEFQRAVPSDNDRYELTAHDLLTCFREWPHYEIPVDVEVAAPVAPIDERKSFEKNYKFLSFDQVESSWGVSIYKHEHVQAMWDGWKDRAALSAAQPELSDAQIDGVTDMMWSRYLSVNYELHRAYARAILKLQAEGEAS